MANYHGGMDWVRQHTQGHTHLGLQINKFKQKFNQLKKANNY